MAQILFDQVLVIQNDHVERSCFVQDNKITVYSLIIISCIYCIYFLLKLDNLQLKLF